MAKKIILTEEQHALIINEILKETIQNINAVKANGNLDEGIWDSVKYGLSKLGRYKANGKIFGKGKIDQEAGRQIQQIIDKKGNELIKNLDAKIKETNPEFPNGKDPQQFLTTVMEIAEIYDSIIAGTKQSKDGKEAIPVEAANVIIKDLREYTKKFLDTDLAAVYSGFDENENKLGHTDIMNEEYELDEEQIKQIDERFGLNEAPNQLQARNNNSQVPATNRSTQVGAQNPNISGKATGGSYQPNDDIEDVDYEEVPNDSDGQVDGRANLNSKDIRANLQAKKGDGEDFDSTRMDTLKSNKLPMTLAGVGASLGAFSWLVNTEWFKHLFDAVTKNPSIEYIKQAVQEKTNVFASIQPNEGMTQIMNRLNGMNLNPNSSPEDFINGVKALGGGNVNDGINALSQQGGIFKDPAAARKVLTEIVNNPHGHGNNLGEIFQGKWAGTGRSLGDSLVTQTGGGLKGIVINTIIKAVPKLVMRTGLKTGAGYIAAKGFGAILGPIGLGLVTAGALVKLIRIKGQKSSRAATLNALYQSMRDIPGGGESGLATTGDQTNTGLSAAGGDNGADTTDTGNGNAGGLGTGDVNARTGAVSGNGIGNISGIGAGNASNTDTGNASPIGLSTGSNTGNVTNTATPTSTATGGNAAANTANKTKIPPTTDELYDDLDKLFKFIVNNRNIINNKTKPTQKQNPLTEGRYLGKDTILPYLSKKIGVDKVTNFEKLMLRIENIRNVVKKIGTNTEDKTLNNFLKQLDSNPIMLTSFIKLTKVNPSDTNEMDALGKFINQTLANVYNSNSEFGSMVDKLNEAEAYSATAPSQDFIRDANSRQTFNKNLTNFLNTIMGIFQYLQQNKTNASQQPQTDNQEAKPGDQLNMDLQENQKLMEEIKRIKKIMLS